MPENQYEHSTRQGHRPAEPRHGAKSRKPRLPLPVQGNCPLGCEKNMERRAESEPQSTGPEPTGLPYRLSRNDSHHMGNAECIRGSMFLEDGKDDKGKK